MCSMCFVPPCTGAFDTAKAMRVGRPGARTAYGELRTPPGDGKGCYPNHPSPRLRPGCGRVRGVRLLTGRRQPNQVPFDDDTADVHRLGRRSQDVHGDRLRCYCAAADARPVFAVLRGRSRRSTQNPGKARNHTSRARVKGRGTVRSCLSHRCGSHTLRRVLLRFSGRALGDAHASSLAPCVSPSAIPRSRSSIYDRVSVGKTSRVKRCRTRSRSAIPISRYRPPRASQPQALLSAAG